jgi:hypothetical protein
MPEPAEGTAAQQRAALSEGLSPEVQERIAQAPQLLDSLVEALQRGAAGWPQLSIAPEQWAAYLAQRLVASGDLERAIASLCAGDLYLCCVCCTGEPTAIDLFQRLAAPVIDAALRGLRLSAPLVDELRQSLMIELLVGSEQRPATVASYGGIGQLRNWLKVVAVRAGRARLSERLPRGLSPGVQGGPRLAGGQGAESAAAALRRRPRSRGARRDLPRAPQHDSPARAEGQRGGARPDPRRSGPGVEDPGPRLLDDHPRDPE